MTTLIRIGNSHGVRIPKTIIEQAQLEDKELQFKVVADGLLIQPVRKSRDGWKEQIDKALQSQSPSQTEQEWVDAPLIDEGDWEW